jgi:CheY-like chemotaxis protein
MVYGFVKQSKGYLRIRNRDEIQESESGAQIDLLLPAALGDEIECGVEQVGVAASPFSMAQSNALVLLVEDNQDVRQLVRNQLIGMGFAVIEANSGDEAVSLLAGLEEVSGVVSDVVMPGRKSGYDVAAMVKKQHPAAFAVLMTGYTENPPETDFEFNLLQKPFDADALAQAISPELVDKRSEDVK